MKKHKPLRSFLAGTVATTAVTSLSLLTPHLAQAASDTYNGPTSGTNLFATGTNWLGGTAPGATTGTTSTDVATFGNVVLTAATTVTVDANRNLGGITFDGTNTSTFGYTLSGGNLILSAGGVIQTSGAGGNHTETISTGTTLAGDATFTGDSTNINRFLTIGAVTGSATAGNTSTLTLNGANVGNTTNNGTFTSVTGVIGNGALGGNVAVSKSGAGTWALSGTNTYTGGTTVSAGTLVSNAVGSLGGNGATVNLAGGTLSLRANGGNNSAVETLNYNKAITVTGDSTLSVQRTSIGGQKTLQINSLAVTGSSRTLNITNAGGYALQVTGATTINGNTTFNNTMNSSGAGGGFATNTVGFSLNTLTLDNTAAAGTTTATFAVVAPTLLTNVSSSGNGTGSFNFVNTGGTNITGAISDNASDATKILAITKTGTGVLTFSGTNTYSGATTVSAGTLKAGSAGAFSSKSAVTLANVAGTNLDTTGFNTTVGSLAGGGTAGGNVTLGAATLTTGSDNTSTSYAGVISGTGVLTKTGTGTQTLTGTNTFTGGTVINAGTINTAASGTNLGLGNVTINGGALTLNSSGIGALTGVVNFTQTTGSTTFDLATLSSFDTIAGTGTFAINGGTIFLVGTLTGSEDQTYQIFKNFTSGTFGNYTFDVSGLTGASGFFTPTLSSAGVLSFTAVPEPRDFAIAVSALLGVMVLIRRRRMAR